MTKIEKTIIDNIEKTIIDNKLKNQNIEYLNNY